MCHLGLLLVIGVYTMSGLGQHANGDAGFNVINSTASPVNATANNSGKKGQGIVKFKLIKSPVVSGSSDTDSHTGVGRFTSRDVLSCEKYRKCLGRCDAPEASQSHRECRCDTLCWFYGDCCLDYYESCLKVDINESDQTIMLATLSKLDSYGQVLELKQVVKLIKMSNCAKVQEAHYEAYMVGKCSTDPESQVKFDRLLKKLNEPSNGDSVNAFVGITKSDIVDKCHRASKPSLHTHILDSIPVSWTASYTVHFQNVFCALCNGINPEDVDSWESKTGCENTNNSTEAALRVIQSFPTLAKGRCRTALYLPKTMRICAVFGENYVSDSSGSDSKIFDGPSHYGEMIKQDLQVLTRTLELSLMNTSTDNITNNQIREDKSEDKKSEIQFRNPACSSTTSAHARICQMYNYPFFDKHNLQKNPHCRICQINDTAQNESLSIRDAFVCSREICSCVPTNLIVGIPKGPALPDITDKFPRFGSSFRILFDFRRHRTEVSLDNQIIPIESKACSERQMYVPHYHECRDIVCLNGGRLVGHKCIAPPTCSSQGEVENECDENDTKFVRLLKANSTVTLRLRIRSIIDDDSLRTHEDESDYQSVADTSFNMGMKLGAPQSHWNVGQSSDANNHIQHGQEEIADAHLSLMEVSTMLRLWRTVMLKRGRYNADRAVKKLTSEVHTILVNHSGLWGDYISNVQVLPDQAKDYRNGTFLFLIFSVNDADSVDSLLAKITRGNAGDLLATKAHEHNFLLDQLEVSNNPYRMSQDEIQTKDGEAPNHGCAYGEMLAQRELKLYTNENQSYFIQFKGESASLAQVVFTATVDIQTDSAEISPSSAQVGVCEQTVTEVNCSYVYFNMSDVVVFEGGVVVTKHARNLTQFLSESATWKNNMTVTDLVDRYIEEPGLNDSFIYSPGSYILEADGVYVCTNYSQNYNLKKVSESNRYLATSYIEQIATLISLTSSIVCLVAVLVVYIIVSELRNIPGKIIMSMSSALLLAQLTFLCSTYPRGLACEVYAAVQHAAWLSSFAWLTVMACNLAYVLYFQYRGSSSMFHIFSGVCWVGPLLLTSCCFALDKVGVMDIGYGANGVCWIGNAEAMIYAFGVPVFTLLLTTLVSAVFVVRAIRKSSQFRHKNTLNHTGERVQLLLCVNLSLLMGLNWVFYILAVVTDTAAMWTVFILTNGSQGCYIFLCYVARKTVLVKLAKQLNICQGSLEKSAQDSPTESQRVTKSTSASRSPAASVITLHLRIGPYDSPGTSPTTSPNQIDRKIPL